jgi:hypothetical protein
LKDQLHLFVVFHVNIAFYLSKYSNRFCNFNGEFFLINVIIIISFVVVVVVVDVVVVVVVDDVSNSARSTSLHCKDWCNLYQLSNVLLLPAVYLFFFFFGRHRCQIERSRPHTYEYIYIMMLHFYS